MEENNKTLINIIKNKAPMYLDNQKRDDRILDAMLKVDRMNFLPISSKKYAYEDRPLSIGYNQTCSQPSMVAFMLDKLNIQNGNKVLEIGAGCGYASAIISILCGSNGSVYASEIIPELANMMRSNLAGFIENITIISQDGSAGFTQFAPFDRILISAGIASRNFNKEILISQLTNNGIMLYPETYGNIYVIKRDNKNIINETFFGVSFVPLRGINS